MSLAWQFYFATLLVFLGVNSIAGLALNLQYGVTGIMNFGFVAFQAIGAYAASVTTLGPSGANDYQHYVFGMTLPWPLPLLVAAVAGGVLALVVGSFALRPRDRGYQAMILLIVSVIALTLVDAETTWLNGSEGLSGIPKPFSGVVSFSFASFGWFYVGLTGAVSLVCFFVIHRITSAPFGRRLRAIRENSNSAAALGVNVVKETMVIFVVGGMIAAVSGGVMVQYLGAWSPGAWGTFETFLYLVALVIGGLGNNGGAILGVAVVATGILEGVKYIPNLGAGDLVGAIQVVLIAVLLVVFLWARPQGLLPERKRRFATAQPSVTALADVRDPREWLAHVEAPIRIGRRRQSERQRHDAVGGGIIEVVDLRRSFGGVQAVNGVTFSLPEGKITGLIGPNGAGKSTVLNLIAGTERPDDGAVYHRGALISNLPAHRIANRGIIRTFQLSGEFAKMTVLENVLVAAPDQRGADLWGAMAGKWYWGPEQEQNVERARELIERFELKRLTDDLAAELSGGQKRLLEIARALMARPEVLLLDEPLAGVAPALRQEVEDHLKELRDEGLTMLMVEHELDVVERCADSVVAMGQGQVIATGTMEELRRNEEVMDAFLVS
jgi:branched-chain amino acid transport system permease protein